MTIEANGWKRARELAWLLTLLVFTALVATGAHAASPTGKAYGTPEDAAAALAKAAKAQDRDATLAILGDVGDWISSGDAASDRATIARFVAAYEEKHAIVADGKKATLVIGNDGFPFAFPLVKTGNRWRFDAAAGREELLARRIGANELDTVQVLQAIVDAEQDYASEDRDGDGLLAYAQKFESSPGKRDGLYWPTNPGEPASPLGLLVARGAWEGYRKGETPTPFHGYYYRMLKGQAKNAKFGAFDYAQGRGIGGFAVVAYPAKYGNSGIMSFIVNQEGKIYQSDLGPNTHAQASRMQLFDPSGWSPVNLP